MQDWPFVSVIMPVRNEAIFIEQAIRSILDNDYPADKMELIVVDGMSDDGTRQIVEKLSAQDSRIKLIDNPEKIVPFAMNRAIDIAKGEYIIRVDAHSEYSSDYIKSAVEVLERTGAGCVGGYMETLAGADTLVAKAISLATSSKFGVGGSKFRTGGNEELEVDTVPFGCFRKEVFEKAGKYNVKLVRNQDIELSTRIRKAGFRIIISPAIKLKYYNRATFKSLRGQSFSNGKWNAYTLYLIGGGLRPRHLIPAVFVLGLIFFGVISFIYKPMGAYLLLGYVGLYLTCAIVEALRISVSNKSLLLFPFILLSFVQMHLWYGLGTIWGMISAPFIFKSDDIKTESAGR